MENVNLKTLQEFVNYCNEQLSLAKEMAKGNALILKKIEETSFPQSQHFLTNKGEFMRPPGFTAKVIYNRAEDSISYTKAMTLLINDDTAEIEDGVKNHKNGVKVTNNER